MKGQRYTKAIERNLAELQGAILNRTTLLGMERNRSVSSLFLKVAYRAIFNDYVARCIKVFERSRQSASFWYVYRCDPTPVDACASELRLNIAKMEAVSAKLAIVRNKTHFHIDEEGVLDPKTVWRAAGITGKQLAVAVDEAWSILTHLQKNARLPKVTLPEQYTVEHVFERVMAVQDGSFNT